jgi:ABC-type metal ion transport system substrate-binding protein
MAKRIARKRRKVRRIPKGRRIDVTREEFNRVIDLLNERGLILKDLIHNQDIQLRRIAQIQAELDAFKRAWEKFAGV